MENVVCLSSRNGNRARQIDIELGCPETNIDPDPSSRVVTQARIGFRARVTYFELGCPETNIDPLKLLRSL